MVHSCSGTSTIAPIIYSNNYTITFVSNVNSYAHISFCLVFSSLLSSKVLVTEMQSSISSSCITTNTNVLLVTLSTNMNMS